MLTGKLPLGFDFPRPSQKAKVDSSLDKVLLRALEKNVARRYQNIREFKQAVEAVVFNKKEPLQKKDRSDFGQQLSEWARVLRQGDLTEGLLKAKAPGQLSQWVKLMAA